MNQRRLLMASLLLAVLLVACASPTPAVAPTEAVEPTEDATPGVADTPTAVAPTEAPVDALAAGAAAPTLIYFHATW